MPELPEVETVRRILEPQLAGKTITEVNIRNPQIIAHPSSDVFISSVSGKTIKCLERRGKFLIIYMTDGNKLVIHLRMTGQILVVPPGMEEEKHTHAVFSLSDGNQIRYTDVRRFGRFWFLKNGEEDTFTGMDKLGPEPFDNCLTADYLINKLNGKNKPIKAGILDQSVVAGIGNIYADEILYHAGIFPEKKCCDLTGDEWSVLAEEIPKIMNWGITTNKITPDEYLRGKGKEYRNTPYLRAYGHTGQECSVCGNIFEHIVIGGRSSCYCPGCQRK